MESWPLVGVPETMLGFENRVRDLWTDQHEPLWRAVLAWSGDREIASEAVAEAFAQVLRRGSAVDNVAGWVWTASFRIAGGLLQERRRGVHLDDAVLIDGIPAEDRAAALDLVRALQEVSEQDRSIVVLCLLSGWESREVGEALGLTAGAVRVRLHRARRRLQEILEEPR